MAQWDPRYGALFLFILSCHSRHSRKSLMKTSADEKENAPSHEQPASVEDGVFVDDKEVIIHGSDIALEKTKDVRDASVVEVDNAASDSITTDNVDDTTLNEKDNEIIAVKDIPSTSEVESVPAAEHGTPADSDLIAPVANTIEANTIDDSVNDSAIEIPAPVLEKKQDCAKDDEDDAALADGVKLVETGNHNEAVQLDKRDATDNVDDNPAIMNQAPNGETLAIAEIALQGK
ncbi:hypothetical protein M378DRAFT_587275 [Amanita muscaria Koide BX008]|uniref:Uncharacterized protein n=1 Tax=Amanita muscaria (strain Koide BX008) TaxID=946122 RepID=A0A0C2SMI8_AMAMK|nr:hypothetical protein M378DRAFT_587275 [Amanita muscaria Koide BX008]